MNAANILYPSIFQPMRRHNVRSVVLTSHTAFALTNKNISPSSPIREEEHLKQNAMDTSRSALPPGFTATEHIPSSLTTSSSFGECSSPLPRSTDGSPSTPLPLYPSSSSPHSCTGKETEKEGEKGAENSRERDGRKKGGPSAHPGYKNGDADDTAVYSFGAQSRHTLGKRGKDIISMMRWEAFSLQILHLIL